MIRGIYTGASAMVARTREMDVIANNLANINTTGYKKDFAAFKARPEMIAHRVNGDGVRIFPLGSTDSRPVVGRLGTGVELNEVYNQKTQSGLRITENPLDLSLDAEGFFAIQTEKGIRYSRNGSFTLNQNKDLVTHEGYPVLNEQDSLINLGGKNVKIDKVGRIYNSNDVPALPGQPIEAVADGELIATLKIVRFDRPRYLEKEGNSFFRETEISGTALSHRDVNTRDGKTLQPMQVIQGALENSNVNPVQEMVKMIEVQRAYEASQKTISASDQILERLINNMSQV